MAERGPSSGTIVRVVAIIIGSALLLYAVYLVRQIVVLVLVAMFLAVGLDPAVRALGRLKLTRAKAVLVVFLLALLFIGGFVASVTPPLVRQTQRLAKQVPMFATELSTRSDRFRELDERYDVKAKLESGIGNLPQLITRSAGSALGIAGRLGRAVFSMVTVMILTIYFLLDLPNLIAGAAKLLPRSRRERVQVLSVVVFDRISGYMLGQLSVSLIAGIVSFIVLTLLRVPYSLPLAMWISIAALIPMVGSTIGAVPAVIVAFFHSLVSGIGTVVFFAIYQQIENYVISPRIMRRAVNISPAAVILAALVGATLLGFVGALLAIPVAASLKVLAQEVWIPRQDAA